MTTYGIIRGYSFDFEAIAQGLFRVTKKGGVVVWVVGDRVKRGRTLSSFRQALYFQEIGFYVHDVMIYRKKNTPFMRSNAYTNCYEFMFVLSKGNPKTFNPLKEPTVRNGMEMLVTNKGADAINNKFSKNSKKKRPKQISGLTQLDCTVQHRTKSHSNILLYSQKRLHPIILNLGQMKGI